MTNKELKVILDNHKLWLRGKEGGVRAYLKYPNLKSADLEGAHLYRINRLYTSLEDASINYANLMAVNLMGANLKGANFKDAYFLDVIMPEGFKGETE